MPNITYSQYMKQFHIYQVFRKLFMQNLVKKTNDREIITFSLNIKTYHFNLSFAPAENDELLSTSPISSRL